MAQSNLHSPSGHLEIKCASVMQQWQWLNFYINADHTNKTRPLNGLQQCFILVTSLMTFPRCHFFSKASKNSCIIAHCLQHCICQTCWINQPLIKPLSRAFLALINYVHLFILEPVPINFGDDRKQFIRIIDCRAHDISDWTVRGWWHSWLWPFSVISNKGVVGF